jgi:aminopeptidase N
MVWQLCNCGKLGKHCLNESFADLSEILWAEHKYGNDVAGAHIQKGLEDYLSDQNGWNISLIRYDYPEASYV